MGDEDWLEIPVDAATTTKDSSGEDWLKIEDPNAGQTPLSFQHMIDTCMRGTDRVMATDGKYVAYRPFNREFDKETNPRTKERMNMFRAAGHYKHLGTYGEVEIYETMPGSPYYHEANKAYVVGRSYWGDIRQAAQLAYDRKWAEYHDFIHGMATAMKGGNRDAIFAKTLFDDAINQIGVQISNMGQGAPTEKEVNDGFLGIRQARGIQGNNGRILLNTAGLQKVGFTK